MYDLLRLYPSPGEERLHGLYLRQPLVPADWGDRIFVYSNFVASLDGRIAIAAPDTARTQVPKAIANPRDWRLFQELAARADILLSSGRYLRELKNGQAQSALPVSRKSGFEDLHRWRRDHGYRPQPDVAIMSASLDFDLPDVLFREGRRVFVFTTENADSTRAARHRARGAEIVTCSGDRVRGNKLVQTLERSGYRRLYSVTGPKVLASLVRDDVLDALFVTTVHRLIGGEPTIPLLQGHLPAAASLCLRSLYLDRAGVTDDKTLEQVLARYDRRR